MSRSTCASRGRIDRTRLGHAAIAVAAKSGRSGISAGAVLVKSSLVGTSYRAAERGASPIAEIGVRVTPQTAVCMVDVLGEMIPVRAGAAGIVAAIHVEDGAPVEFGQVLAVIEPVA
jgi:acetyl-CoA carboxylase biotin carboxyl carrier protein